MSDIAKMPILLGLESGKKGNCLGKYDIVSDRLKSVVERKNWESFFYLGFAVLFT